MRFIVCVLVNKPPFHQTSVCMIHIKTSVEFDEWEHGSWFVHRTGCSTLNELGPHDCKRLPASFTDRKQTKRLSFHHVLLCIHWQKHKKGFLSFAFTHLLLVDLGRTGVQAMQINNWSLMLPRIASHSFSVRSKIHLNPAKIVTATVLKYSERHLSCSTTSVFSLIFLQ